MNPFRILVLAALVSGAALASAKPPFLKVFFETYGIKPESKIGKARCLNCHLPPGPPDRNVYGKSVQKAMVAANSRKVTAEILKTVEKQEFSKGVTYLARIKKDVPPGDPAPKPKKAAVLPSLVAVALLGVSLRSRRSCSG